MNGDEQALQRFQPQLRYDSNEAFFADSAAEWTDNPGNTLREAPHGDKSGKVIAAARPDPGQPQLELAFLGGSAYANGAPTADTDLIGCSGTNYRSQYVALRQDHAYANRMYGRAKRDLGRLWLQYWFFYFYNDYNLAGGVGLHEGDWEMVQLRIGADDVPDLAVFAQHRWAEVAPWEEVEKLEGHPETPVVYVARGSHASYFRPGYHETEAWYDLADGKRETPKLTLEIVGDEEPGWIAWRGSWGDTRPRISGLDQPSPTGPCRHKQWDHPAELLHEAKTARRAEAAPAPRVAVSRAADRLRLAYDFSDRKDAMPDRLVVTLNSEDDSVQPRTFTFELQGERKGAIETEIELKPAQRYDIYVSAVDADGRPTESALTLLGPVGSERPEKSWALSAFARVVAWFRRRFGAS